MSYTDAAEWMLSALAGGVVIGLLAVITKVKGGE